jgi:hypothetical protein
MHSALGVGECGREIFILVTCSLQFAKAGKAAKPLQQEKNNSAHAQRGKLKMNNASELGPRTHTNRRTCPGAGF